MQTNDSPQIHVEDWPGVTGSPGIAQGRYGTAGNFELVGCAEDDGLWVGWFNADREESPVGALPGAWSGALRFAGGHRYTSARITQATAGPNFLEVVGVTEGGQLRRHVWSPDAGFVDYGALAEDVHSSSRVIVREETHRVYAADLAGVRTLSADLGPAYPHLTFTDGGSVAAVAGPARDIDAAAHDEHVDLLVVDSTGDLLLRCSATNGGDWELVASDVWRASLAASSSTRAIAVRLATGEAGLLTNTDSAGWQRLTFDGSVGQAHRDDAVAICASSLDGRPEWQVIESRGRRLWHHRVSDVHDGQVASAPVVARVRVEQPVLTCHRDTP